MFRTFTGTSQRSHRAPTKLVLVFIHGFNVTFADAVRRTGQLAYDIGHHGPAIAFSWPSRGDLSSYSADEATIEWTAPHLAAFLTDLVSRAPLSTVNLIAHSMGARVLVRALDFIEHETSIRLLHAIFAAPDDDRDVFKAAVGRLSNKWQHATMYANSHDEALAVSRILHKAPRAGDSMPDILVCSGIDSIDASRIVSDFIGHSYFGDNNNIISDLFYLLKGTAMPRFRLNERPSPYGSYWAFSP
jgi:esterase/lipase superfamily enzyme